MKISPIVILPVPGPVPPKNGGIVPPWLQNPDTPVIQPWPLPKVEGQHRHPPTGWCPDPRRCET